MSDTELRDLIKATMDAWDDPVALAATRTTTATDDFRILTLALRQLESGPTMEWAGANVDWSNEDGDHYEHKVINRYTDPEWCCESKLEFTSITINGHAIGSLYPDDGSDTRQVLQLFIELPDYPDLDAGMYLDMDMKAAWEFAKERLTQWWTAIHNYPLPKDGANE